MLRVIPRSPDLPHLSGEPRAGKTFVAYRRADQLGLARELKPIIDALVARVERDRNAVDDYILIGRLFRLRGEPRRALRLHRNLTARPALTPEQKISIFTEVALDLQACRSKDFGESYFLQALALAKNHLPALEGLVRTHEQKGQFAKAVDILQKLIRLHRPEKTHLAFVLSELALQHLGSGSVGPARRFVERALRADPDCIHAYVVLSDVFVAARRHERAVASLRSILERWPSHSFLALRRLEDIHYRMNDFPGFEDTLRSCIRTSPDNFYLYYSLARHLRKKHREKEALEFLRRSLEMNPLYINSLRDWISVLGGDKPSELVRQADLFFSLFKRSRRFICPNCLERYVPVTWNCSLCGTWGVFEIRYELPAP